MGRGLREIIRQSQFKSDLKRIARSGRYHIKDLLSIVGDLSNDIPLDPKHRDHNLSGNWRDFRECHIKPDWLLIYQLEPKKLILVRTGSHSELF
ncbi:MAG: type II toxin-antitoxin system YafQ family toxin [Desulfamplus sp.]|nr:type II toxin-antitoxin system YafQ family toxin [Desulfamplus sp.]